MIRTQRHGPLHLITLARPERRNALTPAMLDQLRDAIAASSSARALVLAGDGAMFCAGFDLAMCEADPTGATMRRLLAGLSQTIRTLRALPIPVVLAAQGGAIAGGAALLAGADLVVTDRAGRFGYPVHRLGVSPAVSAPSLSARIGPGPTRRLQMEGPLISADEAHRIGWVHTLVDRPDQTLPAALEQATTLASKPGGAIRTTRLWLDEVESALTGDPAARADAALAVSVSLVTSPEERRLLRAPVPVPGPGPASAPSRPSQPARPANPPP